MVGRSTVVSESAPVESAVCLSMMSRIIADLPTPDKIFSHVFTLVGLETGQNLRMGAIYVIFMLQKCVSYIMCYIIL